MNTGARMMREDDVEARLEARGKGSHAGCTLRLESVLCGKPDCGKLHGPYWYGWIRVGLKTRKVYFGRISPSREEIEAKVRKLRREHAAKLAKRRKARRS